MMAKKYKVTLEKIVQTTYYSTVEVEAMNEDEAYDNAVEQVDGWVFGGEGEEGPTLFGVEEVV